MKATTLYLLCFFSFFQFVSAQTVALDPTFGTDGKVIHSFDSESDVLISVRIQPDGKILTAGMKHFNLNGNVFITRFNSDGSIDTGFGVDGVVMTPLVNETGGYSMMTLQTDGKILITGSFGSSPDIDTFNYATQRYNVDGTLDSSFGTNGTVVTDFHGSGDIGLSVKVQTDDKIVVAGYSRVGFKYRASLVRYFSNGGLDTSFGIEGKLVLPGLAANSSDFMKDMKILQNNKIALGLVSDALETNEQLTNFGLAIVNADGTLDTGFGGTGMVVADLYGLERLYSISESNGAIIVVGHSQSEIGQRVMIAKYLPDGTFDASFGDNGLVRILGSADFPFYIPYYAEVLDNGKILAAGLGGTESTIIDFTLAQFNSDGTVDTGFNQVGYVLTDFNVSDDRTSGFAIQPNGSIVCVGSTVVNSENDAAMLRYNLTNLSATDFIGDSGCTIYPNPFTDVINVDFKEPIRGNCLMELYDLSGRKLQSATVENANCFSMPMPAYLSKGGCILRISNDEKAEVFKIVKQ